MVKCGECQMELRETKDFKKEIVQTEGIKGYMLQKRNAEKLAMRDYSPRGLILHKRRRHESFEEIPEWKELAPTYQDLFGRKITE